MTWNSGCRAAERAGFSTSASIAVLKRFAAGAVELENLPETPPADDEAAE